MNDPAPRSRWDVAALRAGGSVALVIAVPLSILAVVLNDESNDSNGASGVAQLLALLALFAFVIGSGVAAWHQDRGTPLSHGIVAAVGAYILGQACFLLVKLISGGDIRWGAIVVNLTLTLVAGTVGGVLGSVVQRSGVRSRYRD